jgi:hypothetical protein
MKGPTVRKAHDRTVTGACSEKAWRPVSDIEHAETFEYLL